MNLMLALRPLAARERVLLVDWGTSYANTFLLIEPRLAGCDLTVPGNPLRRGGFWEAVRLRGRSTSGGDGGRPVERCYERRDDGRDGRGMDAQWPAQPRWRAASDRAALSD
ncbi:MAG TPA: hypothetical protein VH916_04285 [Dehalococcoidia bacterium]